MALDASSLLPQSLAMTDSITIRSITSADRAGWEPLWKGYQAFYEVDLPQEATDTAFARFLDPAEPMDALVAEHQGEIVGIVHFLYHRSTWTVANYCYLQDLFTLSSMRGKGVARALIEAVYARARKAKASRVYWLTQEGNATARILYDKIADLPGFVIYRKVF